MTRGQLASIYQFLFLNVSLCFILENVKSCMQHYNTNVVSGVESASRWEILKAKLKPANNQIGLLSLSSISCIKNKQKCVPFLFPTLEIVFIKY